MPRTDGTGTRLNHYSSLPTYFSNCAARRLMAAIYQYQSTYKSTIQDGWDWWGSKRTGLMHTKKLKLVLPASWDYGLNNSFNYSVVQCDRDMDFKPKASNVLKGLRDMGTWVPLTLCKSQGVAFIRGQGRTRFWGKKIGIFFKCHTLILLFQAHWDTARESSSYEENYDCVE